MAEVAKRLMVYVAGPYTKPDPCANTHRAVHVGQDLWDEGYCPVIPHLTLLWNSIIPNPYQMWMDLDLLWLERCDVVLRLLGESSGADKEEEHARKVGIPVVYSIEELAGITTTD